MRHLPHRLRHQLTCSVDILLLDCLGEPYPCARVGQLADALELAGGDRHRYVVCLAVEEAPHDGRLDEVLGYERVFDTRPDVLLRAPP